MLFQKRPKYDKSGLHRIMAPEQTINRVTPCMESIGVTRIADISGLDSSGDIPVYSAVRPTDIGLKGISVYNGKGLTHMQAKAGAMMEAIERYCAEKWDGQIVKAKFDEIYTLASRSGASVLNPHQMDHHLVGEKSYHDDIVLEWIQGFDLLTGRNVYIPLNFVLLGYEGPLASAWVQSSNGLASGNCVEEAVCHALAELIERDAHTMTIVEMVLVPATRAFIDKVFNQTHASSTQFNHNVSPFINLRTLPSKLVRVIDRLEASAVEVIIRVLPSDTGLPVFAAIIKYPNGIGEYSYAGGFGCHLDSEIAASRALTEAIQSRNVVIQGAREDLPQILDNKQASRSEGGAPEKMQPILWGGNRSNEIQFTEVVSRRNEDILDDIHAIIDSIAYTGITNIYAVDVSKGHIAASVIKVIIPEYETWFLSDFDPDRCNLGPRAQRLLDKSIRQN